MSIKFNDPLCDSEIFARVRIVARIKSDKELAELLGISGADFAQRKKRGTLVPLITSWAINEDLDLNYLLKGTPATSEVGLDPDPEIASMLSLAKKVLTSGNPIAYDALERNIKYFAHAVDAEIELQQLKDDVKIIKEEFQRLKRENLRLDMEAEEQSLRKKVA